MVIKICLFFFSFGLYYTVNALFFNDSKITFFSREKIVDDTKSLLKEAISVAYASAKLWNENKLGDDDETNDQ